MPRRCWIQFPRILLLKEEEIHPCMLTRDYETIPEKLTPYPKRNCSMQNPRRNFGKGNARKRIELSLVNYHETVGRKLHLH
jgi:hypothetical protein